MKTKLILNGFLALACLGTIQAQNTSYTADAIPIPGTGVQNAAFGIGNLTSNSTGWGHSSVGFKALQNNTTGYANSANGSWALQFNTSGYGNTASGSGALNGNTTGFGNTADGAGALRFTTTGIGNTAMGADALLVNTIGNNNTAVGTYADVIAPTLNNATAIGNGAVAQGNDLVQLGDATVIQVQCWSGSFGATSDGRFKYNIKEDDVKGLEFINLLHPVVYNMDTKKLTEFFTKNMPESARSKHLDKDFSKSTGIRQSGFIAQEVEEAAKKVGYNFNGVRVPANSNEAYSLAYGQFVVPLVKGMQEQQVMIENLTKQLEELRKNLNSVNESKAADIKQLSNLNSDYKMEQNEPNPFNGETKVNYTLPQQVNNAYIAVYDLAGKQITSFPITEKGASSLTITSEKLAAGIYIYSIIADGKIVDTKRMIVSEK